MKTIPKGWLYKPIAILWRDALTDGSGWERAEDFDFKEHELSMYHTTIGMYLGKTKDCVFVAQSLRAMDKMCGGRMSIPLGCVAAVRRIK